MINSLSDKMTLLGGCDDARGGVGRVQSQPGER